MKIRWGVIGAGGIADKRTIPGILRAENAELAAVMDVDPATAARLKDKYSVPAYEKVDDLLSHKGIDAVYIASPVFCHAEQALQVARAGKHMLIEKPVALTFAEGRSIAEAYQKAGLLAGVAFMMRFHVFHQKMRQLVTEGRIGQVLSCRAQTGFWYPDMPGNWRQSKATGGGGALMDVGVHCIDLIQYITGSKARRVTAFTATKVFSYDVDDLSSVLFETDIGAFCHVESSFCMPGSASKGRLEIYGTKGSLLAEQTMSQLEKGTLEVALPGNIADSASRQMETVAFEKIELPFGNMYTKEIDSFSRSIIGQTPLELPVEDGIQVQQVAEAAYQSSTEGRCIEL
jgi:predicted dehydrogenase